MERKIIKNNEISQKPFLITLLKIFNSIQDQLKKLPLFDCKHFLELKGINQSYLHKNIAERLIKKQHEVKLFRETYDQISMMNKKKPKARRSDVFMKFSMVSEILLTRMKEQLSIKGEAKQAMLDSLLKIKDSFMNWGQSYFLSSKNWFQQAKSNKKTTDQYKLKYVFSEIATTNATLKNSRSISKHHKTTNFHQGMQEAAINNEEITFKANPKIRMERHTVNYLHNRSERRSTKKYTKNLINTELDKRQQQVNAHSEESIKEKQQKPERIRTQKKTKFQDDTDYLKSKNLDNQCHQQQQKSDSPSQSMILAPQDQENKKSAYYQSQNYIKSRKNLENVTIFVNINKSKTKKRISNISNDISSTSQIDTPQNPFQDLNYLQPTEGYRSIKFLTRKYIPEQPTIVVKNAKSEKVLSRRRTGLKTAAPANHPAPYEKRPISKIQKKMTDDLQEIRFEKPEPSKKKFTSIKDETIEQPALEVKGTQSNGKNVGEFYAQLGILRTELKKEADPFCQSRSQFFHQQNILWQQQKRRMQRFLDARNKQMYFRQFEMVCTTSNRDQEDAQRAIRTEIVKFTHKLLHKHSRGDKLDQADISKQRQPIWQLS